MREERSLEIFVLSASEEVRGLSRDFVNKLNPFLNLPDEERAKQAELFAVWAQVTRDKKPFEARKLVVEYFIADLDSKYGHLDLWWKDIEEVKDSLERVLDVTPPPTEIPSAFNF